MKFLQNFAHFHLSRFILHQIMTTIIVIFIKHEIEFLSKILWNRRNFDGIRTGQKESLSK